MVEVVDDYFGVSTIRPFFWLLCYAMPCYKGEIYLMLKIRQQNATLLILVFELRIDVGITEVKSTSFLNNSHYGYQ